MQSLGFRLHDSPDERLGLRGAMRDGGEEVFGVGGGPGLPVANFLDFPLEALVFLFLIVEVEGGVLSLLEIHGILPNKNIA